MAELLQRRASVSSPHSLLDVNIRGESYRMKEKLKAGKTAEMESLEELQAMA